MLWWGARMDLLSELTPTNNLRIDEQPKQLKELTA